MRPFASCSIVGPQSATSARAALIMKLHAPSIQMTGFRKTARIMVRLSDCSIVRLFDFAEDVAVPGSSGNPSSVGRPGRKIHIASRPMPPSAAMDQKHHRHMPTPWFAAPTTPRPMITPQTFATRPPPMEWDVFHTLIFVASSCGGIQWAISFAHGGKPVPWKNWFSTSRMPNVHASAAVPTAAPFCAPAATPFCAPAATPGSNHAAICGAKPKATLTSVHASRPKQSIRFGLHLSPTMPFTNFETP